MFIPLIFQKEEKCIYSNWRKKPTLQYVVRARTQDLTICETWVLKPSGYTSNDLEGMESNFCIVLNFSIIYERYRIALSVQQLSI